MKNTSLYTYAETAFHHEGDIEYLIKLIDASASTEVNGVKFQVLSDINNLISSKHSQYDKLSKYGLRNEEWIKALRYCEQLGLDVIIMPLDIGALDLTIESGVKLKYMELHSVSFYDTELLQSIKTNSTPLILGAGGRTLDEIDDKINFFGSQLEVLMHGFQSFPSKLEDVKLARIQMLKERYPNLTIGYADHSGYDHQHAITSNDYAYLLGARCFEKHITITEGEQRVDYEAAVGTEKLKEIVDRLRFLENQVIPREQNPYTFTQAEEAYRNRQKVAVARKSIGAGEVVGENDLEMKMIDNPNGEKDIYKLIGKRVVQSIEYDEVILSNNLSDE